MNGVGATDYEGELLMKNYVLEVLENGSWNVLTNSENLEWITRFANKHLVKGTQFKIS